MAPLEVGLAEFELDGLRACAAAPEPGSSRLPQAGSRKRESMRSVSSLTRSSIASTIQAG